MTDHPHHERAAPRRAAGPEPSPAASLLRLALVLAAVVALSLWFGALPTLLIVVAIIVFVFLHELGHYLTARWAGMKVTEFFLGFGPRLWSFRRGETTYGVKAIPAGAYVRVIGMSNLEEVDPAEEHRTYRQKPYWRRLSVGVAGSAMHFLLAVVLTFVVFAAFGRPDGTGERWVVGQVSAGSPAAAAGLEEGDRVVAVDGERVRTFADLRQALAARPGETVELTVERDGETFPVSTTLARRHPDTGEPVGFLGIGAVDELVRVPAPRAALEAVEETGRSMWLSVRAIGSFFTPGNLSDFFAHALDQGAPEPTGEGAGGGEGDGGRVVSILGAVQIGSAAARNGMAQVLYFLAVLNVFIGVFNLVPLLPLDGGHVAIATYERLRSRKGRRYVADVAKLMPLTYAVVALLLLVGITAVYLDLADPIRLR